MIKLTYMPEIIYNFTHQLIQIRNSVCHPQVEHRMTSENKALNRVLQAKSEDTKGAWGGH
jgi:hypothetical protein